MSDRRKDQGFGPAGRPEPSVGQVVEVEGWSEVGAEAETGIGRRRTKGEPALHHTA